MTSQDPLKSVISISNADDTSLALPSVNQYQSGQQRVLEQVQTLRRTRSRRSSSRSGSSSLSPTSPGSDFVFADALKSQLGASNGNNLSHSLSLERNFNRLLVNSVKGSTVKREQYNRTITSAFPYERGCVPAGDKALGQPNSSRSEPELVWQQTVVKRSHTPQRLPSNRGTVKAERSTNHITVTTVPKPQPQHTVNGSGQSKTNTKPVDSTFSHMWKKSSKTPITELPKSKGDSWVNGTTGVADITMKEAVEYLSFEDEAYKHCGASYIQHYTFIDDKAKEEVFKLKGIPPLVDLLCSPSVPVHQTASAALRNLSFKNNNNKEEIHRCGGITKAVDLLRETDSVELQKQLTGLLWNLSSVDNLKSDLLKTTLPVLMERVILPYTTGPDRTNRSSQDPDVFFHATGCIRNLSSRKQSNRQALRKCRGLVDSLVTYVNDCVETEKPDDKSVENCVCILHNLTFRLEDEAPALFDRITALAKPVSRSYIPGESSTIGCFSPQNKSSELEPEFDILDVVDTETNGAGWLIHPRTLQNYQSLLKSSRQEETQEACCGALQNLTTNEGLVSNVMSQIIVQKQSGLQAISPLLDSDKVNLQRNAVALVRNLTKNSSLRDTIARETLPTLMGILQEGTKKGNKSDDTLAMACQTCNVLLMKEPKMGMRLLNEDLIKSLKDLSMNGFYPKSKIAAAVLLYNLWSDKDLQSILKKQGMNKSSFVNYITKEAHKSVQIVD